MTCNEARRVGDIEHLSRCPECRSLFEPKGSFAELQARLAAEPSTGCDPAALIDAAYGATVPEHVASCARCRKTLDDFRVVVAKLDGIPTGAPPFPAECVALDESISLAASDGTPALEHCAACRERYQQRRDVVQMLDLLPNDTSLTFAQIKFRRSYAPRWAAAAAILLAILFVTRPTALPPPVTAKTYVSVASVHRLAETMRTADDETALEAVEMLSSIGGPVAEHYLIAALGRRPSIDPCIAAALASMRSVAAVPLLIAHARERAETFLPALAEIADPQGIRLMLEALDEPTLASVAARGLDRMPETQLRPELEIFAVGATSEEAASLARAPNRIAREMAIDIASNDPGRRAAVLAAADLDLLVLAAGEAPLEDDVRDRLRREPRDAVLSAIRHAIGVEPAAAARAAAAISAGELVDELIRSLQSKPYDRLKIMRSLVEIGDLRGIRAVLEDEEGAEALVDAPAILVERAARASLDDPRVVRTLALLPSEHFTPLVVEALGRPRSRVEAIHALAHLRHLPAVPKLISLLDSKDRTDAHRALILITGAPLAPRRSEWNRWWARHGG